MPEVDFGPEVIVNRQKKLFYKKYRYSVVVSYGWGPDYTHGFITQEMSDWRDAIAARIRAALKEGQLPTIVGNNHSRNFGEYGPHKRIYTNDINEVNTIIGYILDMNVRPEIGVATEDTSCPKQSNLPHWKIK